MSNPRSVAPAAPTLRKSLRVLDIQGPPYDSNALNTRIGSLVKQKYISAHRDQWHKLLMTPSGASQRMMKMCAALWGSQSWLQPAFSRPSAGHAGSLMTQEPPEKAAAGKIARPTSIFEEGSALCIRAKLGRLSPTPAAYFFPPFSRIFTGRVAARFTSAAGFSIRAISLVCAATKGI